MTATDIVIVGGGIAGASLGAELAAHASVILLEAEAQPGYHATGRSAAFWSETYGGPLIQPLTSASGRFLANPPADFSDRGFLSPRGAVHLARASDKARLQCFSNQFDRKSIALLPLAAADLKARIPGLRDGWADALEEPGCRDIDVAALHAAYLKAFTRRGGTMMSATPVTGIDPHRAGWRLIAGGRSFDCATVVNAAGAWADPVALLCAARPLGIAPRRRTILQLRVDPPAPPDLPLIIDIGETFYFKGEAGGRIWLSPHDETPSEPCDAAPEELDIARAIDRLSRVVDWRVDHIERAWAGLRSFSQDRLPVFGYDPRCKGLFWFAGQGGFGIQTAPAAAKLAASLLLGTAADEMVADIDPAPYAPGRFA